MTVAFWCVVVALALPYVWVVVSRVFGRRVDNTNPRDDVATLQGPAKWAYGAQLNAFETNTAFVAAVLIATHVQVAQGALDAWALAYVATRVLHGVFYVQGRGGLRSLAFGGSFVCVAGLFWLAAQA